MTATPSLFARLLAGTLQEIVPPYTELEPVRDNNLNKWRNDGAYSVEASTNRSFTLKVSTREFGAALFSDAQHLLNHVAEQRSHLLCAVAKNEHSPSWNLVTLYYQALFAAMAFTRAANSSIQYMDQSALRRCLGNSTPAPGAGVFSLLGRIDPATSTATVIFNKTRQSHFHDAVWVTVCNTMDSLVSKIMPRTMMRNATPEEIEALRIAKIFKGLPYADPLTWPSVLRNGINYRPGFSYRSVVRHNFIKVGSRIRRPPFKTLSEVLEFGESAKAKLSGTLSPFEEPNYCVDLLVSYAVLLERITEEAFAYLCVQNDLRTSIIACRKRFASASASSGAITCFA